MLDFEEDESIKKELNKLLSNLDLKEELYQFFKQQKEDEKYQGIFQEIKYEQDYSNEIHERRNSLALEQSGNKLPKK